MSTPFMSSEEYDERAHALYNEGRYGDALEVLREGLALYPSAVELHIGVGYARLAREEFAWARRAFEEALVLDGEHEDALAGLGEVLLKFGQVDEAMQAFDRTLALGYEDDTDLMLQIGRALFREGFLEPALAFFEKAAEHMPDNAEAHGCIGYAQHRLGRDADAVASLRRALRLDPAYGEARVYLANLLYDAGELEAALREFERTQPDDHWDELGIWRLLELRKGAFGANDPELKQWEERLAELTADPDPVDELLAEVEAAVLEREQQEQGDGATGKDERHLELLGSLLDGLARHRGSERADESLALDASTLPHRERTHRVVLRDGRSFEGTWEEIVTALRDAHDKSRSVEDFMALEARRQYGATGVRISTRGAEEFLRGSEHAGLLRIVR
jgi:Flp pilus assembly protein TadD